MSTFGRYARYERGSPVGDFLARNGEGVAVLILCLIGTVLGLALVAARVSKPSDPVKHTRPEPTVTPRPQKSVAAQFDDALRRLGEARAGGDSEAVLKHEHALKELERKHLHKFFDVRADEESCRTHGQADVVKKRIAEPETP